MTYAAAWELGKPRKAGEIQLEPLATGLPA